MKKLLKELIRAESTLDRGERAVADVLAGFLKRHGVDAAVDTWDDTRANVVARVKSTSDKPGLLFGAHLDVVPPGAGAWQSPPFEPTEREGRIYGRGAADMKGGLCAAAAAIAEMVAERVALKGDIVFAATAGEETDSCGVYRFVERYRDELPQLAGIVLPEPTDFTIVTAHRGMCWLKIATDGRTAHSSMPQMGVNAILKMNRLIGRLAELKLKHTPDPLLGGPSLSINRIQGGNAPNVVPDHCWIHVDIRVVPGLAPAAVAEQVRSLCADIQNLDPDFKAEVRVVRSVPALRMDETCQFVRSVCRAVGVDKTVAVGYTTDGPHFAELGAAVVIFGPGKSGVCHKPDEYIDLEDLQKGKEHFKNIIREFVV